MRIDKDNIKIILILLILGLGIGYSYLNTELNINGTANINSANWNVYWNNVQVKNGSVSASTPSISNKTTVSFDVTLAEPGDYYEFTVDAVNAGTLDAMIDTMDSKLNGVTIEELPAYLDYGVTYEDDTTIDVDQLLLHDSTETYKVRIAYADYIEASDLPDTNQSLSLQFSVTYKQADDNAQPVDHGTTVYTVSSTSSYIGHEMPSDITQYSSASDAMAAFENRPFYLKHVIRNGLIDESYVEFVVTQDMANANTGMTPGTYTLRGIDGMSVMYDENAESTNYCKAEYYNEGYCINPYYESNKGTLLQAFGSSNCASKKNDEEYYEEFECSVSDLKVGVNTFGNLNVLADSKNCGISDEGMSMCNDVIDPDGPTN